MRFAPKTEDEIANEGLLPDGIYDFEITDAEDKTSAKGNEMIALKMFVFDADGSRRVIFDYLLESMPHKLRHAAYVCQLAEGYEAGTLTADDFNGRVGKVKIGVQKDKSSQYPPRNSVLDYIALQAPASKQRVSKPAKAGGNTADDLDDQIPF